MSRFDIRTRTGLISTIIQGAMGSSTDADAQAFFDRVTAAGGTLSATEKDAVNNLVLDLKANSIWTPMLAIYPMVGASAAACAQNLKSSSFSATFSGSFTYASTGITGNGVNGYMNTNFNVGTNLSGYDNHFSVYYRTNSTVTTKVGVTGSNFNVGMSAHIVYVDTNTYNDNLGRNSLSNSTYGTSNAFHNSIVTSTTVQKMFRNGVSKISGSATSGITMPSLNFFYAGLNNNGTIDAGSYDVRQIAFASLGTGLSDTQAANFYTNVQTFQTSLSRNV
jgi:hypothetical protein